MSSIAGSSQPGWIIECLGADRYHVQAPREAGAVEGDESHGGIEGKVMSEVEVSRVLGAYGLAMRQGQLVTVDGFALGGGTAGAAMAFGDAPVLPDVTGPAVEPALLHRAAARLESSEALSEAALMWLALLTMAETAMKEAQDAKQLADLMQRNALEAKGAEITATRSRLEAEKDAATERFLVAVSVAVVVAVLSLAGGGAAAASAQGAGTALNTYFEKQSKGSGAQAQADRMQVQEKLEQKQQEVARMAVDEAESGYAEAKELFEQALRLLVEHSERQTQIVESIVRTA